MSWNEPGDNGKDQDPWGGGRRGGNNDGPPDLDELLRKLRDRVDGLFGGGGGGSRRGGGGSGNFGSLAGLVIGGAVIAWIVAGLYRIEEAERGVILRFGKIHDVVSAGLHWNPPLIDEVLRVNVNAVRSHAHRALMLTEDENIVEVSISVQYRVSDPRDFLLKVRDPEVSLKHAAESALRHVVGGSAMHQVLTEGRELVAREVQTRLQTYLTNYGTGLEVTQINVENTQAPKEVQAAFDDVIKAREDEQRVKNEAQAYANGVIPEARGKAQRIIEEANGYKEEVISRASGEADRFTNLLVEYKKAPEVTRDRLYIDSVSSVLANTSKILVDTEGGNNMLYLPLDRMGGARTQSVAEGARVENLDDHGIKALTDRIMDELRERQRRESGGTTSRRSAR